MIMDRLTGNRLVLWHCRASLDMDSRIAAAGYVTADGEADKHAYALALANAAHDVFDLADSGDEAGQRLADRIIQRGESTFG